MGSCGWVVVARLANYTLLLAMYPACRCPVSSPAPAVGNALRLCSRCGLRQTGSLSVRVSVRSPPSGPRPDCAEPCFAVPAGRQQRLEDVRLALRDRCPLVSKQLRCPDLMRAAWSVAARYVSASDKLCSFGADVLACVCMYVGAEKSGTACTYVLLALLCDCNEFRVMKCLNRLTQVMHHAGDGLPPSDFVSAAETVARVGNLGPVVTRAVRLESAKLESVGLLYQCSQATYLALLLSLAVHRVHPNCGTKGVEVVLRLTGCSPGTLKSLMGKLWTCGKLAA